MYIITHSDLPLQYQLPQATHAAIQFANEYPEAQKKWFELSSSIITLAAKDEKSLWQFTKLLDKKGIKYSKFYEPDIGYALTAIAIEPGQKIKKLCTGFPLAGKYNHPQAQDRLNKTLDIIDAMKECKQAKDQTILQHGLSVRDYLFELIGHLRNNTPLTKEWRMSDWLMTYREDILKELLDDYTLEKYTIFHDCGKPFCKTIDENGRQHFPDHADKSAETWLTISDDKQIAQLIRSDMDIHTLSAAGIDNFCYLRRTEAITLLLTAFAETHSNAQLFGGINSDSFKIKWKQIDKRGRAICKKLFGDK